MKSMQELADDLSKLYEEIREGKIELKKAIVLYRTAGHVIGAYKIQLLYNMLRNEKPNSTFLSGDSAPKLLAAKPQRKRRAP